MTHLGIVQRAPPPPQQDIVHVEDIGARQRLKPISQPGVETLQPCGPTLLLAAPGNPMWTTMNREQAVHDERCVGPFRKLLGGNEDSINCGFTGLFELLAGNNAA